MIYTGQWRWSALALVAGLLVLASCSSDSAGWARLGSVSQADDAAGELQDAVLGAMSAPPGGEDAAGQKLMQALSKFTNGVRSGLAQKRNGFIEKLGANNDKNMPGDSVMGKVADVDKALDGLKSKYAEVKLADPKDFDQVYDQIAALYQQLAKFDTDMMATMRDIQTDFRDAAELLALTRQAQARLTGVPYNPQNPNTDPIGSNELEHLLGGIAAGSDKPDPAGHTLTIPLLYEHSRAKMVAEIRRLQDRVGAQVAAIRDGGAILPNLGDMRPGYLYPGDSGKQVDDAFATEVVKNFATCALGGTRLTDFQTLVGKAYDAAAADPTQPKVAAAQLTLALGDEFFKGQPGTTIVVADTVAGTFRDTVSKATVSLLDIVVEVRAKDDGTLSWSCGPPPGSPPGCTDKRYYVTADVMKAVIGQRNASTIKKIIDSTDPNKPGLNSAASAMMVELRQDKFAAFKKDLEKLLAPLKPVDDAVAAKNVLAEAEVTDLLVRKKDLTLIELQRILRQASDVLNKFEVKARTAREEAGATGRFFDDLVEAFKNSGNFLYTYIANGRDDKAYVHAMEVTQDGSPRLRFEKLSAKARGALEVAELERKALLDTLPTDGAIVAKIGTAYDSLKAALEAIDAPEDSVKAALKALIDSIESRRAACKTGILVVAGLVVVASGGTGAPVLLVGFGVDAGIAVGINAVDGLTGRPREVVIRESIADVGMAAISFGLGVGTDIVLTRLIGMTALTNRCINQTILGRSMRHAFVGSLVGAEIFVGINAIHGKLPGQYTAADLEKLGWTLAVGGGVGFTMSTIVGLSGRAAGIRAANLDGPTLKKVAEHVGAADLVPALTANPADTTALQQLNTRVAKYFNENKYALAFPDKEIFAGMQRLQLLAANLNIVKPPPAAIDFSKKPSLPQVIALLREQSQQVKVPPGADPAYLNLLQSKWRGGLQGMNDPTLVYCAVYEKWLKAARKAMSVGDHEAAMQLLEQGNFWATEAAIGDVKRAFNMHRNQMVGRLKTDPYKSSRDRFGQADDGSSIHADNFKWFEEMMTINGGAANETLGPTQVIDVGGGNAITKRAVYATILDAQGQPVKMHLRTVEIIGKPGPANPAEKEYWVHYTTDIDKIPALRDYIKSNLLPKIAAGNLDAVNEAAYLMAGSVPYELGSSGIARVLQVVGLETAGLPATPFKAGYGVDLNAFTADSLKTFGARMQGTVEPP